MSTIDITKNYRVYSPQQLRNYAYNGLITLGNHDLTDFLEYIFTGYLDKAVEEAREEGYDAGYSDGQVGYELPDEVADAIHKAIKILEDI